MGRLFSVKQDSMTQASFGNDFSGIGLVRSQAMPDDPSFSEAEGPPKGPEAGAAEGLAVTDWSEIVARIRDGDGAAMEELYAIFAKGNYAVSSSATLGAEDLDDPAYTIVLLSSPKQSGANCGNRNG